MFVYRGHCQKMTHGERGHRDPVLPGRPVPEGVADDVERVERRPGEEEHDTVAEYEHQRGKT